MERIGRDAAKPVRIYLTGGATAVLFGWRSTTIDIDLRIEGEEDPIFRLLPELKEELQINLELASPPDFIPELPGWRERSIFIARHGKADFFHFDPYSQFLSKVERGHALDRADAQQMLDRGLVEKSMAWELFEKIESQLYRYPAIDPASFCKAVELVLGEKPVK